MYLAFFLRMFSVFPRCRESSSTSLLTVCFKFIISSAISYFFLGILMTLLADLSFLGTAENWRVVSALALPVLRRWLMEWPV